MIRIKIMVNTKTKTRIKIRSKNNKMSVTSIAGKKIRRQQIKDSAQQAGLLTSFNAFPAFPVTQ